VLRCCCSARSSQNASLCQSVTVPRCSRSFGDVRHGPRAPAAAAAAARVGLKEFHAPTSNPLCPGRTTAPPPPPPPRHPSQPSTVHRDVIVFHAPHQRWRRRWSFVWSANSVSRAAPRFLRRWVQGHLPIATKYLYLRTGQDRTGQDRTEQDPVLDTDRVVRPCVRPGEASCNAGETARPGRGDPARGRRRPEVGRAVRASDETHKVRARRGTAGCFPRRGAGWRRLPPPLPPPRLGFVPGRRPPLVLIRGTLTHVPTARSASISRRPSTVEAAGSSLFRPRSLAARCVAATATAAAAAALLLLSSLSIDRPARTICSRTRTLPKLTASGAAKGHESVSFSIEGFSRFETAQNTVHFVRQIGLFFVITIVTPPRKGPSPRAHHPESPSIPSASCPPPPPLLVRPPGSPSMSATSSARRSSSALSSSLSPSFDFVTVVVTTKTVGRNQIPRNGLAAGKSPPIPTDGALHLLGRTRGRPVLADPSSTGMRMIVMIRISIAASCPETKGALRTTDASLLLKVVVPPARRQCPPCARPTHIGRDPQGTFSSSVSSRPAPRCHRRVHSVAPHPIADVVAVVVDS
jgi:hypothetical protein